MDVTGRKRAEIARRYAIADTDLEEKKTDAEARGFGASKP